MIDEQYKDLFSQIVQSQISRGKTRLDAKKIADYMSKILGMEITVDALVSSLSDFPFVSDITGNVITVAATPEEDVEELDNEESSDDIHDMAVSQAGKNMFEVYKPFRTLAEAIQYIKPDTRIKYHAVDVLDKNSNAYLMHKAGKVFKKDYVVESITNKATAEGKVDFTQTILKCRIDGSRIMVDLPISSVIHK